MALQYTYSNKTSDSAYIQLIKHYIKSTKEERRLISLAQTNKISSLHIWWVVFLKALVHNPKLICTAVTINKYCGEPANMLWKDPLV